MKRLYIDFDGVVMDTIPTLYKACEEAGIDMSNEREKSLFFSVYDFGKIINDDYMLNDSINSIRKLVESGMFEISILTHVNSLKEGVVKIEYIRKYFKERVYNTIIPRLVRLTEAPSHGKPIVAYDPKSKGTEAYLNLAKEVIERNGHN